MSYCLFRWCEGVDFHCKLLHRGEDGLLFDVARVNEKPDIDKFVNQVGAGQGIVRMMEQCSAHLRTNSAMVKAGCEEMAQQLASLMSSSVVFGEVLKKDYALEVQVM